MTTPSVRSPRLLLLATAALAVAGTALLTVPDRPSTPAISAPPRSAVPTAPFVGGRPPENVATSSATVSPAPAQAAGVSAPAPPGEGVAGDAAIQTSLQEAWPADLPDGDERSLLRAGRDLLRADATGVGRARWPALFGGPHQGTAPAFATAGFRIQAAIARSDNSPDRAVVHLVWAGTDRAGTLTDRRLTDWYFTRTSAKGASTWTVLPPA
ncbi:hypothetical protein ACFW91_36845 [Streptomyces asoensis]|uniref:hypothetical protein n=1 Tax=Streptomyces asoensis TaxID=249586 RepID=UPI0036A569FF